MNYLKDLVYMMCAGGCGGDVDPLLKVLRALITLIGKVGAIIFVVLALYTIVKWILLGNKKKRMSGKDLTKKVLKYLVIAIIFYFLSILLNVVLGLVSKKEYDVWSQCWCK